MKNITLLIALLFAFAANAQHAGKKPALLIGKTVTVLNKPFTDMGFSGFTPLTLQPTIIHTTL